jgi:hypothetical protein
MHHSRTAQRRPFDQRAARLIAQLAPDIDTIFIEGDPEAFRAHLQAEVPDLWRDLAEAPYASSWDAAAEFAVSLFGLVVEPSVIRAEFRWRRNYRRLLKAARLVREYAEQLRKGAR